MNFAPGRISAALLALAVMVACGPTEPPDDAPWTKEGATRGEMLQDRAQCMNAGLIIPVVKTARQAEEVPNCMAGKGWKARPSHSAHPN